MITKAPPEIAVLGSVNMDLVINCKTLPTPGETILAETSSYLCGGKGANQAVAAARAEGKITMLGRIGDDPFASTLKNNLLEEQINCDYLLETKNYASGLAVVTVDEQGQNAITVIPGANSAITLDDLESFTPAIKNADILLLQLEIPIDVVVKAIELANSLGKKIILDPAPAPLKAPAELFQVDIFCPNETETMTILNQKIKSDEDLILAAREFHLRGVKDVLITLGDRGTLFYSEEVAHFMPSIKINSIDSTGAGDAFAGALAVFWHESGNLKTSISYANAAGALAASRPGAQASMPSRQEILDLINQKN